MPSLKARFDSLDVTAMVADLQACLGCRIVNVYDGDDSKESFVLKLDNKTFIWLESGIRFHPVSHYDASNTLPSPFCAKLRKHIRGLRVEQIHQIGNDRVVMFTLGVGENRHILILELYSKGNLILTGADYTILALLRSHVYKDSEDKVAVSVGNPYPVSYATTVSKPVEAVGIMSEDYEQWARIELTVTGRKKKWTLKTLLLQPSSGVSQQGPALLEHCIGTAGLQPHAPITEDSLSSDQWRQLREALSEEEVKVMNALRSSQKGYLLYESRPKDDAEDLPHPGKLLTDFVPYLFWQHADKPMLEFDSFGPAVAEFYLQQAAQKRWLKMQNQQSTIQHKLEKIRADQTERIATLEREQELVLKQAETTQLHADSVEKALTVINSALDSGMDWGQLELLIKVEQEKENPIAMLISGLDLPDRVYLRLAAADGDLIEVPILLSDSVHANANRMFAKYRASKEKAAKTMETLAKNLHAAEESATKQLASTVFARSVPGAVRKAAWYEKFHWFISSDNYLVLGGKDAHQNELLVKRYLRRGDAYLHADVHGASSCVLRAKRLRRGSRTEVVPLSEQALREAGNFTICRSSAWTSRMVTSAWWVEAHQVSKTAPSGEYLTVGSFMIRGKKTFLPPTNLEMGLAVLFRLADEASIARHKNDRRDFSLLAWSPSDKEMLDETNESESPSGADLSGQSVLPNLAPGENRGSVADDASGSETDSEPVDSGSNATENKAKLRGLSARDRRMIKKYGSLEEAEKVAIKNKNAAAEKVSLESPPPLAASEDKKKRGKKSKLKRAMKKYGDQDDEDREIALLALHGGEKEVRTGDKRRQTTDVQRKVAAETTAVLVKDPSEAANELDENVRSILAECVSVVVPDGEGKQVRWDRFEADALERMAGLEPLDAQIAAAKRLLKLKRTTRIDNFSASLGGILRTIQKYGYANLDVDETTESAENAKRRKKKEKIVEEVKWKEALAEEGVLQSDNEDDAVDDTTDLDKLTGKPHQDDILQWAIPVCAPYQTLSQYSYRVKLTPGSMKKGKAAKQCVEMFIKGGSPNNKDPFAQRYLELIKSVPDNDWVQTICSDVKISVAGASKIAKQIKSQSKKGKK